MENTKNFGEQNRELNNLIQNKEFIDFISYKEDKWLQYSELPERLNAIFGSVQNAIQAFQKDVVFNSKNF